MLKDLHERFWHAPPADMMRLLQAACLPKDIVQQCIGVASRCPCRQDFAPRIHRPQIKSRLATQFNETVQHDLFFLWDESFMLLIDECIRWKTGDHVPNKTGPVLRQNI